MNVGKEPDDHGIYDRPAPSNGLTLQEVTQIEDYYVNVYTRTRPSLLHFNGRIKELYVHTTSDFLLNKTLTVTHNLLYRPVWRRSPPCTRVPARAC